MWTSTNFTTYKKQFDFTSSEQGKPTYTALKIDDTDFINIIEGLDGEIEEDQIFQTILCSSCGIYHCEPGNWVALRQSDNFVFFIPAFEGSNYDFLSTAEIKDCIESNSRQKINNIRKFSIELSKFFGKSDIKKVNGSSKRGYNVVKLIRPVIYN